MQSRNTRSRFTRLALAGVLLLPLLTGCNNAPEESEGASRIERADTYAGQGQYRSAILEVRNAIQADPGNVEYVTHLANFYLEIGGNQQASELLEPWLKDHPQQVALPLARAYVEQGKHLSATETLARFKPETPEDKLQAELVRAKALRLAGNPGEALALYQNLVAANPSSVDAISGLLETRIRQDQNGAAVDDASDWLAKQGDAPEVLYFKGVAQYRQNELDKAADTLTAAVAVIPNADVFLPIRRSVLSALSRVLTEQGRISEAQVYNKVLAENSNTEARAQAEAAIAAIKDGKVDEAKTILRDMLKVNPENQSAALILGTLEAGSGELDEGTQLLTDNLDPETTPTQFIRAATIAQIDKGDREAALKTLTRAVEARPDDNELLAMHGVLALSLPDHAQEGIASLSKVLAKEPDRVRLRLALANYYTANDQPEQALAQLRMAFTSNPAEWATTGRYIELLLRQGQNKEAGEIRDSLVNGYPDEPKAMLLASLVDARLGNTGEAIKRLDTLRKAAPKDPAPRMALAGLYIKTGEADKAIQQLLDATELHPDDIRPMQQAARLYGRNHTLDEVRDWLANLGAKRSALKPNADVLQALISIRQGQLDKARGLLDPYANSDNSAARRATGQLLLAEARAAANDKRWEDARAKAAEAIALEPGNLAYALMPVGLLQMQSKFDEAMTALQSVEDTFGPEPPVILSRAAILASRDGQTSGYQYLREQWNAHKDSRLMPSLIGLAKANDSTALDTLTTEWLAADPDNAAAHMARADWLMSADKPAEAASQYQQVIQRQPANATALNNLAWLLRDTDLAKARDYARQASELAPRSPAVLDTYGWILHLQGEHAQAKDMIEKALALAPDNADIQGHLETVKKAL